MGEKKFDPEGDGYDYQSAMSVGLSPDPKTKHWPDRNPITGQLLKGRKHKTWNLGVMGEAKAGFSIYKGKDNKYYSMPTSTRGYRKSGLLNGGK